MNQEDLEYERKYSHSHCWQQGKNPACGQPLENHKQCCLCDTVYKPRKRFPSQPNSEEKKMMYGHTSGSEVQFSHSPKPEGHQMTCEIMLGRLESDPMPKCTCTPLPDTTEEKKKHSMLCKSRNVDGKFYAGSYEGMKEPEDCDCHNDTSYEWWEIEFKQKFSNYNLASEAYANGKNYKAIDFVIDFVKSLLSQSEQRVRKEMVEKIAKKKVQVFPSDIGQVSINKRRSNDIIDDIINLISK